MEIWDGIGRGTGDCSAVWSGVGPGLATPPKILSFLFRSPTGVQLAPTSPKLLGGIGDLKLCVHICSATLAPNSQKCCGKP
jgi:hypothetical protein